jgi:hypothetical protein
VEIEFEFPDYERRNPSAAQLLSRKLRAVNDQDIQTGFPQRPRA